MSSFENQYGNLTVREAMILNSKANKRGIMKNINLEKVLVYGISLGLGVSILYLLLILTAYITA
mgnify:CR=1 FL=1